MKSGVIFLTQDASQQAKLRDKLAEYERRPVKSAMDLYKVELMRELVQNGAIDPDAMAARYVSLGDYESGAFNEVLVIIRAYNDNDLSKIERGTGLR